ncbi:MAG TPA: hypothetical protein VL332_01495 [Candidatus Saccharimonadaceae bacterium]|nr:hypothetical protein [Candidatus Saccharimonadaceae bacterium]
MAVVPCAQTVLTKERDALLSLAISGAITRLVVRLGVRGRHERAIQAKRIGHARGGGAGGGTIVTARDVLDLFSARVLALLRMARPLGPLLQLVLSLRELLAEELHAIVLQLRIAAQVHGARILRDAQARHREYGQDAEGKCGGGGAES